MLTYVVAHTQPIKSTGGRLIEARSPEARDVFPAEEEEEEEDDDDDDDDHGEEESNETSCCAGSQPITLFVGLHLTLTPKNITAGSSRMNYSGYCPMLGPLLSFPSLSLSQFSPSVAITTTLGVKYVLDRVGNAFAENDTSRTTIKTTPRGKMEGRTGKGVRTV